jgi:hypothetical protein
MKEKLKNIEALVDQLSIIKNEIKNAAYDLSNLIQNLEIEVYELKNKLEEK